METHRLFHLLLLFSEAAVGDSVVVDVGVVQLPRGLHTLGGLVTQHEILYCQTDHCHMTQSKQSEQRVMSLITVSRLDVSYLWWWRRWWSWAKSLG